MKAFAFAFAFAFAAGNAAAANTGELWEVSTVMNMPGMPAGMGSQKSQVCRDKDAPAGPPRSDCKISNHKRSGLTESMTVSCPRQDTMQVEMTYNAARTEYKGTMKSGDMVINTSGRKVGACDPQVAQAGRDQKTAEMQKKVEGAMGDMRARNQQVAKDCQAAVETMNAGALQLGFMCNNNAGSCKTDPQDRAGQKPMYEACQVAAVEFCKRFQTMEGFTKAKGSDYAAKECKVSTSQLKASFCPRAEKADDFDFAGAYCPAEKERLVKKHCTGRAFTSMPRRQRLFCQGNMNEDFIEAQDRKPSQPAAKNDAKKGTTATDTVTEGVSQGINKLKGLFGR